MSGGSEWSGCNNLIPPGFFAIAMPSRAALDPAHKGRPADEVILDALLQGQLQTQPFKMLFRPAPGIPSQKKSP